jgi:RNA polymerase sigma-70 factor, ECF subfamily
VHARKQSHFEGVVLPHLDRAYNLARWLIENDQDAQAVVEAAFRQARQEFGNLSDADPRNWLLTIVWKRVHNWIEEGRKGPIALGQTFPDEPSATAEDVVDMSGKALPEAANQEWQRLLWEAVSKLPIEFREVLVLREIEGWNYTQLVSVLGIPRSLVVHRLRMARQSLRQELREARRRE